MTGNGVDGNLNINVSGFLDILDMSRSSRLSGGSFHADSIFGPSLCSNPSSDFVNSTGLVRLPPITAMDVATPWNNITSDNNLQSPPNPGPYFANEMTDETTMMPAVDFFGASQFQMINTDWLGNT
ncbi:hypothetical protein Pdw03_2428 [Penicillium digitatum]|nr:hypothetical protein Pdw03_2428 [Penicillium digitatum]